jgi:hypothetical protein
MGGLPGALWCPATGGEPDRPGPWSVPTVHPVNIPTPDRALAEPAPSEAPGGRSAPGDVVLATEVAALAALLAEVVQLADTSALFPSRWAQLAELALEHDSVRAALQAETGRSTPRNADTPPLSAEHIIAQLNQLHDLIEDDHVRS